MFVQGSYLMILENTFSAGVGVSGSYSDISADIGYSMWINGPFCDFSLNSISGSDIATGIRFEISFCLNNDNDINKAPYSKFSVGGNNDLVYRNIVDGAAFGLVAEGSNNTIYVNRITDCGIGLESGKVHLQNYVRMHGIKQTSSVRILSKDEKPAPKVVFRLGCQDRQVKKFLETRKFILDSLKQLKKNEK